MTVMTEYNDNLSEVLAISVQYTNMYILVLQWSYNGICLMPCRKWKIYIFQDQRV